MITSSTQGNLGHAGVMQTVPLRLARVAACLGLSDRTPPQGLPRCELDLILDVLHVHVGLVPDARVVHKGSRLPRTRCRRRQR